jgi:mannitol/fructose-specific phosphotransferase system IIA component (Ntr-type)
LAVTLLGYDLGFFDQTAVNAVVILILMTCLVGPWLVEKYGRDVAIQEEDKPYEPSETPQRILVPLANPETSDTLMDIAFMIRDEKSDQPVFPLTVARDGKDVDAQVAKGEKMLSHAVVHAAAAEVPVNPVTSVDYNIASGIARAVSEKLGSVVIIGWNGATSTKSRIFGSILDQLLQEIDEMVMVSKISKPLSTHTRVLVAVPPFASIESGFSGAIRSLKLMTDQIGAELVFVMTVEREEYIQKRIKRVKPDLESEYQTITKWSELPSWLDETVHDNDIFVLLSAREGSLSWRPALDRLPRVVAQRYPDLSFITVYPSEAEVESISRDSEYGSRLLSQDRIIISETGKNLEEKLMKMLKRDDSISERDVKRLLRRLLKNSSDYSPEMMTGVVLYDAHTSLVDEQMLFIGLVKEGLQVPKASTRAQVVIMLLSPKEMAVKDHLKGVNAAARLIRPGKSLKKLKEVTSPDEVYRILINQ